MLRGGATTYIWGEVKLVDEKGGGLDETERLAGPRGPGKDAAADADFGADGVADVCVEWKPWYGLRKRGWESEGEGPGVEARGCLVGFAGALDEDVKEPVL